MNISSAAMILTLLAAGPDREIPAVELVEVPGGGVQPQAAVDARGNLHLVFLRGEPGRADVYFATRKAGSPAFEAPIRVNSEPGSAIAIGTVRGARIALGREGRVHIAWNGAQEARPANPMGGSPLLYARSDAERTRFEPQRNVMIRSQMLDGGGSIAADGDGGVVIAWHGQGRGSAGEANRRMWVSRSIDDGATFAPEEPASAAPTGACGCCGTAAMADATGSIRLLYRAAGRGVERGMVLLTSRDRGMTFVKADLDAWNVNLCPMSTASLCPAEGGALAAWENRGQVAYARLDRRAAEVGRPELTTPPGSPGNRKHPTIAVDSAGRVLLAWTEGTGWQRGGSLAWQVFDASGRPIGEPGRIEGGVPTWGLATAAARPGGGFTIVR